MKSLLSASIAMLLTAASVLAQGPLILPGPRGRIGTEQASTGGSSSASASQCPSVDAVFRFGYGDKREAAAAALLEGVNAAEIARRNERALCFFMISIERDPSYARAVYNLGVMSALMGLWDDALNFYKDARRLDPPADVQKLLDQDTPRVEAIAALELTPEGKARRRFDNALMDVIQRLNDPGVALDLANRLIKADPSRWEALAAAGLAQVTLGQFPESAKSFEAAARLSPPDRRPQLATAADLVSREGQYVKLMQDGDAANDKKDYLSAAKMYADAWELSPGRVQTGMQAAIAFLMADEVPLAVQTLTRLRVSGTPEVSDKASVMLKELGAISPEAKSAAQLDRSGDVATVVDVAERVRKEVGDLRSAEMLVATATPTKLVRDDLKFVHVNDDQLTNPKEYLLQSNESLFAAYQRSVGNAGASAAYGAPPSVSAPGDALSPAPSSPALPDAPPGPPAAPRIQRPGEFTPRPGDNLPAPGTPKPQARVGASVDSVPEGATVVFDDDAASGCVTPCSLAMAKGRHTIKASLGGYRDILKIIEVPGGALLPVDLAFEEKRGSVHVEAGPRGAPIYVDGRKTAAIVPGDLVLAEGEHSIGVESGGTIANQSIRVRDQDLLLVRF